MQLLSSCDRQYELVIAQIHNFSIDLMNIGEEQLLYAQNNTDMLLKVLEFTELSTEKLIRGFTNLGDTSITSSGVINDILLIVDKLLQHQQNKTLFPSHILISCEDIKEQDPNSPSGYYYINGELAYCEMGELCNSTSGWTRLAYLDMSDPTMECPPGFRLYTDSEGVRACGRPSAGGGSCSSVKFPTNGISYSEVCGRIVGYQYGSTDAVNTRYTSH